MSDTTAKEIRLILDLRKTAALGTLHLGAPFVSMVPFAWDEAVFLIHVSKLATHTNDMLAEPRVSLLITAPESPTTQPQALPQITIQGRADPIASDSKPYLSAKQAYLARFPQAAPIFQLGDFSIFAITPTTFRYIAGFGQAHSITPEFFETIMRSG